MTTALARIEFLLDPRSFVARSGAVSRGDALVEGRGRIHGRPVYIFSLKSDLADDPLAFSKSDLADDPFAEVYAERIGAVMDSALQMGAPVVGLVGPVCARHSEAWEARVPSGDLLKRMTRASGVVPQVTVAYEPCGAATGYLAAMADFAFVVRESQRTARPGSHDGTDRVTELAHFVYDNELACLDAVCDLFRYIPSNNLADPPAGPGADPRDRREEALLHVVPDSPNKPYDMRDVICRVVDDGEFHEVHREVAENILCGFAHLGGWSIGIVASQPAVLAGVLDIAASIKAARFVRFCDAFNLPLLTFVDVPGFLPGIAQEHAGIIKHGAKLLYAYCEATVPKLTVVTRKAYGGAYAVLSSKHLRGDCNLAWPCAEIAVMGARAAVELLWRREITTAADPAREIEARIDEYTERFANPFVAAARGFIDDVIDPRATRPRLIEALDTLRAKRDRNPARKHGNIPL